MLLDFGPSLAQLLVLRFCCSANSSNGVTWASSTPLPFSTNIRRVYRHTRTNFTKNRRRCCCWRDREKKSIERNKEKIYNIYMDIHNSFSLRFIMSSHHGVSVSVAFPVVFLFSFCFLFSPGLPWLVLGGLDFQIVASSLTADQV